MTPSQRQQLEALIAEMRAEEARVHRNNEQWPMPVTEASLHGRVSGAYKHAADRLSAILAEVPETTADLVCAKPFGHNGVHSLGEEP